MFQKPFWQGSHRFHAHPRRIIAAMLKCQIAIALAVSPVPLPKIANFVAMLVTIDMAIFARPAS